MDCVLGLVSGPEWTRNHVWVHARHAALERDGYRCARCGNPDGLHVHHRVPVNGDRTTGCRHHVAGLEVLCRPCHAYAHQVLAAPGPVQLEFAIAA